MTHRITGTAVAQWVVVVPGLAVVSCAVLMIAFAVGAAGADGPGDLVSESLRLCERADGAHDEQRVELLARALGLASRAAEQESDRADAHFAVFCALGKQVNDHGLGWGSIRSVRRVRQAVDRALALDPDHVDALVGKATMLLKLPRVLGGDRDEALRCLERARRVGPNHPVGASMWREVTGSDVAATAN